MNHRNKLTATFGFHRQRGVIEVNRVATGEEAERAVGVVHVAAMQAIEPQGQRQR